MDWETAEPDLADADTVALSEFARIALRRIFEEIVGRSRRLTTDGLAQHSFSGRNAYGRGEDY